MEENICLGYGFDVSDIPNQELVNFIKKHDPDYYADIRDKVAQEKHVDAYDVTDGMMAERVINCLKADWNSPACYLAEVMNSKEAPSAKTGKLFTGTGDYCIFESVVFTDDTARARYIRNSNEFWEVVSQYIKTENLSGGMVYVETEPDPVPFIEKEEGGAE